LARAEELERENRALRKKTAFVPGDERSSVAGRAAVKITVKRIDVHVQRIDGLTIAELRDMADSLKQKMASGVVVLGAAGPEKAFVVVSVTKDLTGRIQAGALIKEIAPIIGGGGGGRPDFAQSGGSRIGELDKALEIVPALVERLAA
jgi:alanyl-tRNA synthetase